VAQVVRSSPKESPFLPRLGDMFKAYFGSRAWAAWSWPGLLVILCGNLFSVHMDVLINKWNGRFMSLLAKATGHDSEVPVHALFHEMFDFAKIAGVYVLVAILLDFFTSHWTFRWRMALTESYVPKWQQLRHIEGASQRIQEDTMRFASTMESLGASLLRSVLSLFAFLPLLSQLSQHVTSLPLVGHMPHALMWAAVLWSLAGTLLLAIVGGKLPGLEFNNQLVEAAYRKELVLGEDDTCRASEAVCKSLFANIKQNYAVLYFNFMYFNIAKYSYLQLGAIFPYLLLVPSISAGDLAMGEITQTIGAFSSVSGSFQFLVFSWKTLVELLSIFKRLRAFETECSGKTMPDVAQAKGPSKDSCSLHDGNIDSQSSSVV